MSQSPGVEPFRIEIGDEQLTDLKQRLAATRWPNEPSNAGWHYGANLGYMRRLIDYWRDGYDWRKWEAELNRFQQFHTEIGGHRLHFLYEKGTGPNPLPMVISHGWPGSVFEFYKVVEPLAHPERFGGEPEDAFDVIAPSLPGFGFSDAPSEPMGPADIADLWHRLMTEVLGYSRYAAQGGDWGSVITAQLALRYPKDLYGIHLNMLPLAPDLNDPDPPLNQSERTWMSKVRHRLREEGGYQEIQGTKPQTLSYGLTDSPAGLAAWMVEKFHGWPGAAPDQEPPFTMDELLTNIMLYWVTGSANSASWIYHAVRHQGGIRLNPGQFLTVPTGFQLPPHDLFPPPPDSWVFRMFHTFNRVDMESGGHFVALEKPTELVDDVRAFFRMWRDDD